MTVVSYRIPEAAEVLGVSDDTLRRWIDGGRLATESGRAVVPGPAPARPAVSLMSREAAEDLALEPGVRAIASVKATNVVMERP